MPRSLSPESEPSVGCKALRYFGRLGRSADVPIFAVIESGLAVGGDENGDGPSYNPGHGWTGDELRG